MQLFDIKLFDIKHYSNGFAAGQDKKKMKLKIPFAQEAKGKHFSRCIGKGLYWYIF